MQNLKDITEEDVLLYQALQGKVLDKIDPTSRNQGRIFTALSKHFSTYDDLLRTDSSTPQKDEDNGN
jgi:hypothetical protein